MYSLCFLSYICFTNVNLFVVVYRLHGEKKYLYAGCDSFYVLTWAFVNSFLTNSLCISPFRYLFQLYLLLLVASLRELGTFLLTFLDIPWPLLLFSSRLSTLLWFFWIACLRHICLFLHLFIFLLEN